MTSSDLTPAQAKALAEALTRHGQYLARVVSRMKARGFPDDDVLYAQVLRARESIATAITTARLIEQENGKPRWMRAMGKQ